MKPRKESGRRSGRRGIRSIFHFLFREDRNKTCSAYPPSANEAMHRLEDKPTDGRTVCMLARPPACLPACLRGKRQTASVKQMLLLLHDASRKTARRGAPVDRSVYGRIGRADHHHRHRTDGDGGGCCRRRAAPLLPSLQPVSQETDRRRGGDLQQQQQLRKPK